MKTHLYSAVCHKLRIEWQRLGCVLTFTAGNVKQLRCQHTLQVHVHQSKLISLSHSQGLLDGFHQTLRQLETGNVT